MFSSGNGPENPIWKLAQEYDVKVVENDWEDLTFYDENGHHNFSDIVSFPNPS